MDDTFIITAYVIIADVLRALGQQTDGRARTSDAEVLTIAVVAAKYFQNNHDRALWVLTNLHYLSGPLSTSRFNRRLHRLAPWLEGLLPLLAATFASEAVYVLDSMPVPVCRRVRARRSTKLKGRAYWGYCAAKKEKFFGWRLHLVCTPAGVPVHFELLPASWHDLTPVHELTWELPAGAKVLCDKAYNSAADEASILQDTEVRLVPIRKANRTPNEFADWCDLKYYRHGIETRNSQLVAMGLQQLHARSNEGISLKVQASLLALICTVVN
jgi:hypothetical protein